MYEAKGPRKAVRREREPEDFQTDQDGVPIIRRTSEHIAVLERRRGWLERRIESGEGSRKDMDRSEAAALLAAQVALTYHRNRIQRMDEPYGLLREVVEAYEGPVDEEGRLRGVVARAKLLLEEFPEIGGGK